jgi:hypothetical protein
VLKILNNLQNGKKDDFYHQMRKIVFFLSVFLSVFLNVFEGRGKTEERSREERFVLKYM